jgi:hypothetical protein
MKLSELEMMVREMIREEMQSIMNEDEYDRARDAWLDQNDGDWNEFRRKGGRVGFDSPEYSKPNPQFSRSAARGRRPFKPTAPAATSAPGASKDAMLQQKIKYKDMDGTDREATVKSLLAYAKDHPGRQAAARVYAQYMAKNKPKAEGVCEGDGCLDEKSVPEPYNRKTARKMDKGQVDKRKKIGRDMLSNEKTVSKFRKQYGDKWKSYLWAAASSAAFRSSGKSNKNK